MEESFPVICGRRNDFYARPDLYQVHTASRRICEDLSPDELRYGNILLLTINQPMKSRNHSRYSPFLKHIRSGLMLKPLEWVENEVIEFPINHRPGRPSSRTPKNNSIFSSFYLIYFHVFFLPSLSDCKGPVGEFVMVAEYLLINGNLPSTPPNNPTTCSDIPVNLV